MADDATFLTPAQFLAHWQGHRRLTRQVIEAFPEPELFRYRVEPMRTFGEMSLELIAIGGPMVKGIATGDWGEYAEPEATSRSELLALWDTATAEIEEWWPRVPEERFHETVTTFGQFESPGRDQFLYALDNEIHHRGQGYVYLRALGIEPPSFWERE